ncbi:MAG TPA: hypothetical protein VII91_04055 [Bauldia sp.]
MDQHYYSVKIDEERTLCLAPLTERRLDMAGQDIADVSGYFLYEQHGVGDCARIEILAQLFTDEAAQRLRQVFSMA